jgi:hypothetical protein
MRPRAKQSVLALLICVLVATGKSALAADPLMMPRDLVDYAAATGCAPIDNFFERPGMVNPPYVYGWLPGDQETSAAFWCRNTGKRTKPYSLKFKIANPAELRGCAAAIEWSDFPGGLSVETRPRIVLNEFYSVTVPQRRGPSVEVLNARVLVSYYDGLSDTFYCHKGEWLFASTE